MMYDFLLMGGAEPARLTSALAGVVGVPVPAVSVVDDEGDHRRDAIVFGTRTPAGGDVTWSLSIYVTEAAAGAPDEEQAACDLAVALGEPVLCSAQPYPPSAFWLFTPDGGRTRARLYEGDEEELLTMTVDAVERPVAMLPHVRVEAQPEVIREHRMPTPVTDAAAIGGPAAEHLAVWEGLTARMTGGWPPDGWYPAAYFQEDLRSRDHLEAALQRLPAAGAAAVAAALGRLDEAFRAGTVEVSDVPQSLDWWWRRVPDPLPWRDVR